jgi:tetratricopeptide (TPR) repeat protein
MRIQLSGRAFHALSLVPSMFVLALPAIGFAQGSTRSALPAPSGEAGRSESARNDHKEADSELQIGTKLTRQGLFMQAIPHLLFARGRVANTYAANFNLALCYVGARQYKPAIEILEPLRREHGNADVENLLAQAYVGDGRDEEALEALKRAMALTPENEKLFLFVADACLDSLNYQLGLKLVDLGLSHFSTSAKLHYQRGLFLSLLDDFDDAKPEFASAARLAPDNDIGYLASSQQELFAGNPTAAVNAARQGVGKGFQNPALLTVLAEALMRAGARPGDAEFAEAQTSLEKALSLRPQDANTQLQLGKVYLIANRLLDAIARLEAARELAPTNESVYSSLARAYQRHGDAQKANDALNTLAKLNQSSAERIGSAPGDGKANYAGTRAEKKSNQ